MIPVGRLALITYSLLSFETRNAEFRTLRTVTHPPAYNVTGPLVSVIIPAYNEEKYLPALLYSLPHQTYDNIEVIVVDNESEDRTVDVAEFFGAKVCSHGEFNISKSRNMGAEAANGEIYVFIDADSIPEAVLIERSVENIMNGYTQVYSNLCSTDNHIHSLARVGYGIAHDPGGHGCFVAVPADVFWAVGGYDEAVLAQEGFREDLDICLRTTASFGSTKYLRWNYTGTSERRQISQGFSLPASLKDIFNFFSRPDTSKVFWEERAIRRFDPCLLNEGIVW